MLFQRLSLGLKKGSLLDETVCDIFEIVLSMYWLKDTSFDYMELKRKFRQLGKSLCEKRNVNLIATASIVVARDLKIKLSVVTNPEE